MSARMPEREWSKILALLRWNKPGLLLLIIPALWAAFLSSRTYPPAGLVVALILIGWVGGGAGCVVDDLWDRNIDREVKRTSARPLASRVLSIKMAIVTGMVALLATWMLASYLRPISLWLLLASMPVIILYPLAKRVLPVPQLVLGIAWGFAVLISWTAGSGRLEFPMWLLGGATALWAVGFDIINAMADRDDDRRIGVNSGALFFGRYVPFAVGAFFLGAMLLLGWLGIAMQLRVGFWVSLIVATLWWARQCARLLAANLKPADYGEMFRHNIWIGFILLLGMISSSGH